MNHHETWVLTDTSKRTYIETFDQKGSINSGSGRIDWHIHKERLRGGLSDGVDLITVTVGNFEVAICPTRGMGIWKGTFAGHELGWDSPVKGPVNPALIQRDELGGIGWLAGFDEWIVRCGLNNNGGPAVDRLLDNTGAEQSMAIPLHGRIANIPAHFVAVSLSNEPAPCIEVHGIVDEAMLFFPQLRLDTRIRIPLDRSGIVIHDRVINRRSQPAELELLYHTNFGPPMLEKGSRFLAPIDRLAPINAHSQKGLERWNIYPGPIAGVIEECFVMKLLARKEDRQSMAMIQNRGRDLACLLRFSLDQLPWFTLWRNPGALSDGYVTGLEPGTDLPNAKPFERQNGRVVRIPAGESYESVLSVEVTCDPLQVKGWEKEIADIQSTQPPRIERGLPADLTPG
ncbi:aldose 1-epimerase family protein [bacterium]|nr:aldose 1-epimerase family protein [bacterium]